jgi:hypothetical protein
MKNSGAQKLTVLLYKIALKGSSGNDVATLATALIASKIMCYIFPDTALIKNELIFYDF